MTVPFNKPYLAGKEIENILKCYENGKLAGDGPFTKQCHDWLERSVGCTKALLTHSCTAALEMAAILLDLKEGDEVIMPSYTFVSTANAFVLRGAVPVFVDIRQDTLNIDETLIESAITKRTKAVVPVHYAGVSAEMDEICDIAAKHGIAVVEDAAQGLMATYKKRPLGSMGNMGCLSFHETKNVISGEGGALLINDQRFSERAEIIREKGTNRSQFFRGQVDKYTWCDVGSSFLPGELIAAFLAAQLESAVEITAERRAAWELYHSSFYDLEQGRMLRRPSVPDQTDHNAHMYYILLPDLETRTDFINFLNDRGVSSVFHYVPLHNSIAGLKYGRTSGSLVQTERVADRLVRLPMWVGMNDKQAQVISVVKSFFDNKGI